MKNKKCPNCNEKTPEIKRGFGEIGSICGNARIECLVCGEVKK